MPREHKSERCAFGHEVETISQDCFLAEEVFEQVTRPRIVDGK